MIVHSAEDTWSTGFKFDALRCAPPAIEVTLDAADLLLLAIAPERTSNLPVEAMAT